MLVFVDESGDPGMRGRPGSSKYFVVTSVIFSENEDAEKCEQVISKLRQQLQLHAGFEFHFNKCSKNIRRKFLEAVAGQRFEFFSMVMNKGLLWSSRFKDAGEFYRFTAGIVFDNSKAHLDDAIVLIDRCGDCGFRTALAKHLKEESNRKGSIRIKKVKMQESHTNNLLQLADMVCGAVARSFNFPGPDGSSFRRLISRRERRVQLWPTT